MKKLLLFLVLVTCSLLMSAQVYYLLPNSAEWNSEAVNNVYDNPSAQNQLQWETSEGDVYQCPERQAYEWFKDTYNGGAQKVITYKDLTDGRLAADGNLFGTVKVVWVYVDRWMTKGDFDSLFPEAVRTALANYVKAGGNLYLSTFAARLVWLMGRTGQEPGFAEHNGFGGCSYDDPWRIKARAFNDGYNIDNHGHAIYKYLNEDNQYVDDYRFNMQRGTVRTDRNCVFDQTWNNPDSQNNFESNNTAKVLAGWGHEPQINCAGLVEFYPVGDWKGTIITNGLAACSWAASNESVNCVKLLTRGVLDYLSAAPALVWNEETIPASGVINEQHIMTASAADGYTIRYYPNTPVEIANIGDGDGNIYFNYFGTATFRAEAVGDGWNKPKNKYIINSPEITVNGGDQNVKFAYVLPYSMHTMANYDNEESLRPDFEAANWFYHQFIVGEVGGQHGCFVSPSDVGSLNSAIKVIWINNDHVGKGSADYYTDLGGDTFRENLRSFINAGGNVFVSKQATRLVGDLGRNEYPQYQNSGYDNRGPWRIGNKWNLGGTEIDHSTHAVYANMGTSTTIMAEGRHTDNNDVWFNFAEYANNDPQRLIQYETDHNCRILGAWGHDDSEGVNSVLENAGMVEFYPQSAGQGTIIAMGLAAFHWATPTDLLKNFTRDILYYLNISEVPGFAWIVEPVDGTVGAEQIAQVEDKATAIAWTSSNTDVVEIVDDPEHPADPNYKKLILKAVGEATITVTRSADGYKIPKNVTSTTTVTKTITVTNGYVREGLTAGNYYTICLPKAAASFSGAKMFRLVDKTDANGIVIEEVEDMNAGEPFIFRATATSLNVTYADGEAQAAKTVNGLVGHIGEDLALGANTDYYILADNQIWCVDATVTIPSNRAYIDMSQISTLAPVPGRPRYVINSENTATGIEHVVNGKCETGKLIRDGQLLIMHDNHIYNAQGQTIR